MHLIVVDGGPCAGKTTIMSKFIERTQQAGLFSAVVPEAATTLFLMGFNPKDMGNIPFQKAIVDLQLQNETFVKDNANKLSEQLNKDCVLFLDRGLLTGAAYLDSENNSLELFQEKILKDFNLTVEKIRAIYTGIIYMDSAAVGAEEYYTLANNGARTETVAQAKVLNERGKKVWLGHSHLVVIPNTSLESKQISFDEKIKHALQELCRLLGIPVPIEIENKYLLENFNPITIPVPYEVIDIEQRYLIPKQQGAEERVRKRSWMGGASYFHTIKSPGPHGGRFETERHITKLEYKYLLKRKALDKNPIHKERFCFLYENQYFEVDIFFDRLRGLQLLEIEHTIENQITKLPPFLSVKEDVTHNEKYRNGHLATLESIASI